MVLQREPVQRIAIFEKSSPTARNYGVRHEGEFIEDTREEELADQGDAAADGDFAAFPPFQLRDELLQVALNQVGIFPFKGFGQGAGCNELFHRVDEGSKVFVPRRVGPIAAHSW